MVHALEELFQPAVLLTIVLAAAYGLFVGAIPGLTATMAVALLLPLTFFLDDVQALAAIVTLVACAIFAGDIPTALVRIPGTPSSVAYADDAYALTRSGRQELALGLSLTFSVVGGLFGAIVLMTLAPQLAKIAEGFGYYENFWLCVLGLSCAAMVARGSIWRGALALLVGLLLSTVGHGAVHTIPRFTFGIEELREGVNFIPAMIGLFGMSEVFRNVLRADTDRPMNTRDRSATPRRGTGTVARAIAMPIRAVFEEPLRILWRRKLSGLRSSGIGCLVGMLPGAGADIAAWISYAVSRRFARDPERYGSGSAEAIADATAANNSALAGAWVPALVFGIPGDSVTAIVIGVLLLKNITPGPEIFANTTLLYGIYFTFVLANLVLIPLGFLAIRIGTLVVHIPRRVLLPAIVLFSIVGAYAIRASYVDIWVMVGMGLVGFVLERREIPLGPVVLGIILGRKLEESFIQSVMVSSSALDFFSRPQAAVLGVLAISLWCSPLLRRAMRRAGRSRRSEDSGGDQ